jgi:phage/plasmid primase-like uncharacterized protein
MIEPVEEAIRCAIEQAGLPPPAEIITDGQIHRYSTNGERSDKAGWYVFFGDGVPAGKFGDWRTGLEQNWCAKKEQTLTAEERAEYRDRIEAARRQREEEERIRREEAAAEAQRIWDAAAPAPADHAYLVRKHVQPHGLRLYDGCLVVPLRDTNGALHSLQSISQGGTKRFLTGGRVVGLFFLVGEIENNKILVAEGYATAASLHEATGHATVVAFHAGNLQPVAEALRAKHPNVDIIICADYDDSGVGQAKAQEAAEAVGARVVLPSAAGMDWNDVACRYGLDAVRTAIPGDVFLKIEALHGVAGELIRLLEPHTEADPVALLITLLSEFGCMVGRAPHLILDGSYHPLLIWTTLVGTSAKARKGSADNRISRITKLVDEHWTRGESRGTLSSGEGLVEAVRDAVYEDQPVKERGKLTGDTVHVCVDPGIADKRLFLVQGEFGSVLRIMGRDGNSLSGVLRDAWDGKDLAPMTKTRKIRATNPHIACVGHVTQNELQKNLSETDAFNGFANRFIWCMVQRSKLLPFSSEPDQSAMDCLAKRIRAAVQHGRTVGRVDLTEDAKLVWAKLYPDLSAERPGLRGSLLARAEAHVLRLAAVYALLDVQRDIDVPHLTAALAVWQYAEASVEIIFGDSTGDPDADAILRAIRRDGSLSDTQISELFQGHRSRSRLDHAKRILETASYIMPIETRTGGRSKRVWIVNTTHR